MPADPETPETPESPDAALDRVLRAVADAHPDRVDGWLRNEPGQWGFLAGQAVLAVRRLVGRRLNDAERRWVWHRMWQTLEERRRQFDD